MSGIFVPLCRAAEWSLCLHRVQQRPVASLQLISGSPISRYGSLSVAMAIGILALHAGRRGRPWRSQEHAGMERSAAHLSC